MTVLGLLLILLSWVLQVLQLGKGQKLHVLFLFVYSTGVGFLVMDSFFTGNFIVGSLNLLTLCLVLLLLLQYKR